MNMEDVLTTVHGRSLTVSHVLEHIKAHGIFRNAIYELIELEVINLEAEQRGITVSREELNDFLNIKRGELGLADAVAVNDYCAWLGISYATWANMRRNELLRNKLRAALVTDEVVAGYFERHAAQLKNVSVARIGTESRESIEAVCAQVRGGGADFGALAREYSVETATRSVGGYVGTLRPGMLPGEIDEAVFSAAAGDIVGPFSDNGRWWLYQVVDVEHGELSGPLREQIAESLFEEWLTDATHQARA